MRTNPERMGTPETFSDPIVLALLGTVVFLLAALVLRKSTPVTHVQRASHGGTVAHHHDARVSVVVMVERRG